MSEPTEKQKDVLRFIFTYTVEHFYQPSYREIMAALGIGSTNALHDRLLALRKKGYVSLEEFKPRAIGITTKGFGLLRKDAM